MAFDLQILLKIGNGSHGKPTLQTAPFAINLNDGSLLAKRYFFKRNLKYGQKN